MKLNRPTEGSELVAYLAGRYDQCALLLRSPRLNKPQREVIVDQAFAVKDELEALGVEFTDGG
jgi:hypothetical protein